MKMKKMLLTFLAALIMAVTMSGISAFADAHYYKNDFETASGDDFDKYRTQLDDGNWVAQKVNQHIKMFDNNPVTKGKFYIGFDANWQDIGKLQTVRLINNGNGKTYMLMGAYANSVKYSANNDDNWQPLAGAFKPESGTTVHFDIVIDFDAKTISYYKDGKSWGTAKMSNEIHQYGFKGLSFVSDMKDSTLRPWYIDNLIMTDLGEFLNPQITDVDCEENYVILDFKAPLGENDVNLLSKDYVKIFKNGGDEVPVNGVEKVSSSEFKITFDAALEDDTEYCVEYPSEITGIFNQQLSDTRAYFTKSGADKISYIMLTEENGKMTGLAGAGDEVKSVSFVLNGSAEKSVLDEISIEVDGETVTPYERLLENNVYTVSFSDIIGADKTCVIKIPQSMSGAANSERRFLTGEGKFEIRDFKFVDSDSERAEKISDLESLSLKIINTDGISRNVYLLLCAYDSNNKMTGLTLSSVALDSGVASERLYPDFDLTGVSAVKGFVIEEMFGSDGAYVRNPLCDAVVIGE